MTSDFYAGCVYRRPVQNPYAPRDVGDLSLGELQTMRLTGLPIRVAHGKHISKHIGRVTDEYMGGDGSKHIEFEIFDEPDTQVYRESLRQQWYHSRAARRANFALLCTAHECFVYMNDLCLCVCLCRYTHLSLGHDVDPSRGMVPQEVSICHLGARDGTTIYSGTDLGAYKQQQQALEANPSAPAIPPLPSTMSEPMNTAVDAAAAPEATETPAVVPAATPITDAVATADQRVVQKAASTLSTSKPRAMAGEKRDREEETTEAAGEANSGMDTAADESLSPEEKALQVIQQLSPEQQDTIAQGWTMTSQKLADTHQKLENAQKSLQQAEKHNETLKIATQETAKQLVASLKEAYEEYGTAPPERYMSEIEQATCGNPTLAQ